MAGATLALCLDGAGFKVALVDTVPPSTQAETSFDGRASAIAFTGMRLWNSLGLAEHLKKVAQPIHRIVVTDGPASGASAHQTIRPGMTISATDIDDADPGEPLGWMIENRRIRQALQSGLLRSTVTLLAPATVTGMSFDGRGKPVLSLEDGRLVSADLVVGAEGRRSIVREAAGIGVTKWDYGQTGVVCTVELAQPHDGTAWQHFMPGGPLAILPLTGDRASLVWSERTARAEALVNMPVNGFQSLLSRGFGDALGSPAVVGGRFSYPLSFLAANSCVGRSVALIGDAAHGVHPIAGQGLNLGLKDVAALSEILSDALELGEDIGSPLVLDRYARWRRLDVVAGSAAADVFARTFSSDDNLLRSVRGIGLSIVNQLGPVRRLLAREAGGAVGDLPTSLQA